MQKSHGIILFVIVILAAGAVLLFDKGEKMADMPIMNFEECAAAGNAVMESYPRQCRDKDGNLFVEVIVTEPSAPPVAAGGCYVGGCSSQICSEDPQAVSTCEFREEYACYKTATCERQASGECGWTGSAELSACLSANSVVQ